MNPHGTHFQNHRREYFRGGLTEEAAGADPFALLQRWLDGRNLSRRIPKDDLPAIARAVDGYQRFVQLADEFAALTETLTRRSGPLLPAKKNSSQPHQTKNSGKPKTSSRMPSRK